MTGLSRDSLQTERENTEILNTDRITNSGEGRTQVLLDLVAGRFCSVNGH